MADIHPCYLLVLAVSAAFLVYGFILLLKKETSSENDVQTIQRQIRGFAFIMLSSVVLALGAALCMALTGHGDVLKNAVRFAY